MSLLVNVSSFTNKVLVRKGTSSPSTTAACRHNANAKMDFTCILMENATNSSQEVCKQLFSKVTLLLDCQGGYAIRKVNIMINQNKF